MHLTPERAWALVGTDLGMTVPSTEDEPDPLESGAARGYHGGTVSTEEAQ